jgi:hypothetical protein
MSITEAMRLLIYGIAGSLLAYVAAVWAVLKSDRRSAT